MPADIIGSEPPPPRGEHRRIALAALGGGLSVILLGAGALAVSSIARADTPSPSMSSPTLPDPSTSSTPMPDPSTSSPAGDGSSRTPAPHSTKAPDGTPSGGATGGRSGPGWHRPGFGGFGGFGGGGILGPGIGLGGALHGTAVVKTRDGSFETVAAQRGTVTAVSATSISVKSDDQYQATYVIDKNTVVNGVDNVTDVKKGDNVAVVATVDGDKSTATRIVDLDGLMAKMQQFKDRFPHGPWSWDRGGSSGGQSGSSKSSPKPSATSTA